MTNSILSKLIKFIFISITLILCTSTSHAFDKEVHIEITEEVLRSKGYSEDAVTQVAKANRMTDRLETFFSGAHFLDERFAEGSKRLREKLDALLSRLDGCQRDEALNELGRCLHAIQDFFAHSNFIERASEEPLDLLNMTDPENGVVCAPPDFKGPLTSGYWPDDRKQEGKCSHGEINKDGPESGQRHLLARAQAKLETSKFVDLVEDRIKKRASDANLSVQKIDYLKGTSMKSTDAENFCK